MAKIISTTTGKAVDPDASIITAEEYSRIARGYVRNDEPVDRLEDDDPHFGEALEALDIRL